VQAPTAQVQSMNVNTVDADGFTMDFGVDVANPNSVSLPVANADYELSLALTKLTKGSVAPKASIPAQDHQLVHVPVRLNYKDLLAVEQAIVKNQGDVPYSLDANLSFGALSTLFGNGPSVPLHYAGTLPLRSTILQNPTALAQNPIVQRLASELISGMLPR